MNDLSIYDESKVQAMLNEVMETPVEEVPEKKESVKTFDCLVVMPSGSADVVLEEMKKRAEQDETIAKGLADKSKSIKGCISYICGEMKKFASKGNSSLMVQDEQVFGLAVHYYTETNEMLGIAKTAPKATTKTDKPKSESKPKQTEKKDNVIAFDLKPVQNPTPKKQEQALELSLF